jgi:spermidine synthase
VATVLIGIALGSEAAGRMQGRVTDPVRALALVEVALGLTAIASLPAAALVARLLPTLETSFGPARLSGNPIYFFLIVFAVILLPSLCMGASFPLAAQIYARQVERVGQKVGEIYSANVLGATLGSITVGFVMLPLIGAQRSLLAAAVLNLIAAASLLALCGRRPAAAGSAALALAALGGLVLAPNDLYRWLFAAQYPANRIVANFEDVEMTVTVTEYNAHHFIFLNGHHQAETLPVTLGIHRLIGHLPAVVHGGPKTALVIGLGGGATGGAVAQHVRERLDIVELSAGMVEAAGLFAPYNEGVLSNPRTHLVVADGRNFLLLADTRYDVITADIIPPLHAYSSLLYSYEYFRLLSAHLTPGGVVSQWLDRRLEPHEQDILTRTFVRAFPHVALWQHEQYTLLLGSNQPIRPDLAALSRSFSPQLAADLAPLGIRSPGDLAGGFRLSGDDLRAAVGPGLILTDDHPYNEYFRLLRIGAIWRFLPEN